MPDNRKDIVPVELAVDLGIDLSQIPDSARASGRFEVTPPAGVRIGGKFLSFEGIRSLVIFQPEWLFTATDNDANLPSTLLKKYQVVFDYPGLKMTLAEPGHRGGHLGP